MKKLRKTKAVPNLSRMKKEKNSAIKVNPSQKRRRQRKRAWLMLLSDNSKG